MSPFYLYIVSSKAYLLDGVVKLGYTKSPRDRLSQYLTGCPPLGDQAGCDLDFYALWETTAVDEGEICHYEDILHDRFTKYRLMRWKPRDTEWFRFPPQVDVITTITGYVTSQIWYRRTVDHTNLPQRPQRQLLKPYNRNISNFITDDRQRRNILTKFQTPVIKVVHDFLRGTLLAGQIIAPCGSGKTFITCMGLKGVQRLVVCVPSVQLIHQWRQELIQSNVFEDLDIKELWGGGLSDEDLNHIVKLSKYCIITTRSSSKRLIGIQPEVVVFDEAHHMAGVVAGSSDGPGITRKYLESLTTTATKRLFLTFTPRIYRPSRDHLEIFSMDDEAIFGTVLASITLRELITAGILPDYRIWTLRSPEDAKGLNAKIQYILEAWRATEIIHGIEKPILNHLVIFTRTIDEAIVITEKLYQDLPDTLVARIVQGEHILNQEKISAHEIATRGILVNVNILGEGVNIPILNSVAIMDPRHSLGAIIQMLLRAGRWFPEKSVFHMLFPIVDSDDMTGFEQALRALASIDEVLRDEITTTNIGLSSGSKFKQDLEVNTDPEHILIDTFDSTDLEAISRAFNRLSIAVIQDKYQDQTITYDDIRQDNQRLQFKNMEEYERSANNNPMYIPDPQHRFKNQWVSWYHFLGVDVSRYPKTKREFVSLCKSRGLTDYQKYREMVSRYDDLPDDPYQLFDDFEWNSAMGLEEEIVW